MPLALNRTGVVLRSATWPPTGRTRYRRAAPRLGCVRTAHGSPADPPARTWAAADPPGAAAGRQGLLEPHDPPRSQRAPASASTSSRGPSTSPRSRSGSATQPLKIHQTPSSPGHSCARQTGDGWCLGAHEFPRSEGQSLPNCPGRHSRYSPALPAGTTRRRQRCAGHDEGHRLAPPAATGAQSVWSRTSTL